jgi:hypothetical protein
MTFKPPIRLSVARPYYLSIKCGKNYNHMTTFDRWVWWNFWRHYYWFIDTVNQNKWKLDATWKLHPYMKKVGK